MSKFSIFTVNHKAYFFPSHNRLNGGWPFSIQYQPIRIKSMRMTSCDISILMFDSLHNMHQKNSNKKTMVIIRELVKSQSRFLNILLSRSLYFILI